MLVILLVGYNFQLQENFEELLELS